MAMPDLQAVDELCQLARAAQRIGCTVRLEGVADDLRALLDLAGVGDLLIEEPSNLDPNGADLR